MKKKTTLWSGVSILIVAVLAITAFARGNLQLWLYGGAFAAWGVWAAVKFLMPYLRYQKDLWELRRLQKERERDMQEVKEMPAETDDGAIDSSVGFVLLRHVNHRISAYLKSAYPEAAWEWCEKNPERLIAAGGTGRIRLFHIPDYNYAEVRFDKQANIDCSMLKMVPITDIKAASKEASEDTPTKPAKATVDPQIWYEVQGRKVLESLISDLTSRGHSNLLIKDSGEICIQQADAQIKQSIVENMPERVYWPSLTKVFERNGIAAKATDAGMVLSW